MVPTQNVILCSCLKKTNKDDFYELIWSDFYNILLGRRWNAKNYMHYAKFCVKKKNNI